MSSTQMQAALTSALKTSAYYTHGTRKRPTVAGQHPPKRAVAPVVLKQWLIQSDDFLNTVVEQYKDIAVGETRMLMAGTGVGKSTAMPLALAASESRAGLVLAPMDVMAYSCYKFVSEVLSKNLNSPVKVEYLRTSHMTRPVKGAVVYYSDAISFLLKLHADPKFIENLGIAFLYLDEAHYRTPEYILFKILIAMDFMQNSKNFYGSATAATDIVLKGSKNTAARQSRSPALFNLTNPVENSTLSPLHGGNIADRTLIFLASDSQIDSFADYYDTFDIHVIKFYNHGGSTTFNSMCETLKKQRRCVILSSGFLQISFTMDVETVICCGRTVDMVVDYSRPSAELIERNVTESERTQRLGRVGRHMAGKAIYSNVETSPEPSEISDTDAVYVWMWMKLFNIETKQPLYARFDEMCPDVSLDLIATLMTSKLHPALVLAYLDDNGKLFRGWGILKYAFHDSGMMGISDDDNEESVQNWPMVSTGPLELLEAPQMYSARATFPKEWALIPYVAWQHYIGEMEMHIEDKGGSVVSAMYTPSKASILKRMAKSIKRERSVTPRRRVSRPESVMTIHEEEEVVLPPHLIPAVPSIPDVYKPVEPLAFAPSLPLRPHVRTVSADAVEHKAVADWVSSVSDRNPVPRDRDSDDSIDVNDLQLVRVSAVNYRSHKLYPYNRDIFQEYVASEHTNKKDFDRYDQLRLVKVNFASPHKTSRSIMTRLEQQETQKKLFLSVVRVHNTTLMRKLQFEASERDDAWTRFTSRFRPSDLEYSDEIVTESAKLLDAMAREGFFVAVDQRVMHSGSESSQGKRMGERLVADRKSADITLLMGDPILFIVLNELGSVCRPMIYDDVQYGIGWAFSQVMLLPAHVYDRVEKRGIELGIAYHRSDTSDIVICESDLSEKVDLIFRGPVDGEMVYVVSWSRENSRFETYGPFKVRRLSDVWCVARVLASGYSGSLIVAMNEGAILGVYMGEYTSYVHEKLAYFTSTDEFVVQLKRCIA